MRTPQAPKDDFGRLAPSLNYFLKKRRGFARVSLLNYSSRRVILAFPGRWPVSQRIPASERQSWLAATKQ